jgi:Pyruvate/2-oxoacid:ferredoxin oxidoreductase gamma subunit
VEKAIETSVKPKTVQLNLTAFAKGYDYGCRNHPERKDGSIV